MMMQPRTEPAGAVSSAGIQSQDQKPQDAKALRKQAGVWLKELRGRAGLSQIQLAARLSLKYYTFVSQVENGFGRVPIEGMEAWARALGVDPTEFAKRLLSYYEPVLYRLLYEVKA